MFTSEHAQYHPETQGSSRVFTLSIMAMTFFSRPKNRLRALISQAVYKTSAVEQKLYKVRPSLPSNLLQLFLRDAHELPCQLGWSPCSMFMGWPLGLIPVGRAWHSMAPGGYIFYKWTKMLTISEGARDLHWLSCSEQRCAETSSMFSIGAQQQWRFLPSICLTLEGRSRRQAKLENIL